MKANRLVRELMLSAAVPVNRPMAGRLGADRKTIGNLALGAFRTLSLVRKRGGRFIIGAEQVRSAHAWNYSIPTQ